MLESALSDEDFAMKLASQITEENPFLVYSGVLALLKHGKAKWRLSGHGFSAKEGLSLLYSIDIEVPRVGDERG